MSKAFTREDDEMPERTVRTRQAAGLPAGAKNYVTADGAQRWRDELNRLLLEERPRAPKGPTRDAVEAHIVTLQEMLRSATVVAPPTEPTDDVRFGATVTVRRPDASLMRYRIVGVSEADPDRGWESWTSPCSRALIGAKRGDRVRCEGAEEWEIVEIAYSGA